MPGFTLPMDKLADGFFPLLGKKIPVVSSDLMSAMTHEHYTQKAFTALERVGGATKISPPLYYGPLSSNKYHGDAAQDVSDWHQEFVHTALDKIKGAVDSWRPKAKFKDLKVMALMAIGAPGCLDGADIKNEPSFSSWQGKEDNEKAYIKAVVTGFSAKWMEWSAKVIVALPWYPAFCAFPGPQAPPMPNIPMPLIAAPSAMMPSMAVANQISDAMIKELSSGVKDKDEDKQHEAIFKTIAFAVSLAFLAWLPMQQIMNVLGKGPIPPFAPPPLPAGPVVAGDNIGAPGHIAA